MSIFKCIILGLYCRTVGQISEAVSTGDADMKGGVASFDDRLQQHGVPATVGAVSPPVPDHYSENGNEEGHSDEDNVVDENDLNETNNQYSAVNIQQEHQENDEGMEDCVKKKRKLKKSLKVGCWFRMLILNGELKQATFF